MNYSEFPEFEVFARQRYDESPWDLPNNPHGFARQNGSDISAHLPFLEFIARTVDVTTEMGTRYAYSTSAFIRGCKGKVISYDIAKAGTAIDELIRLNSEGKLPCREYQYIEASTIDPNTVIEPTDLLFIDTLHCYRHIRQEFDLHLDKVSWYLCLHDTTTDWEESLDCGGEGIGRAIVELIDSGQWKIVYHSKFNHGLMLLERI